MIVKTIRIVGENYFGSWCHTRSACRAIIVRDDDVLLSYETATGQYMLPGGGVEGDESEEACCRREVVEETGFLIEPSRRLFGIDEYYEDARYVSLYFTGEIVGRGDIRLTDREKAVGMRPVWLPLNEIVDIFSRHADYADTDEMRRGLYLREYTALKEFMRLRDIAQLTLADLQPSQFYISEKKLADVRKWFDPADMSRFEAIPVRLLDGLPTMTDGHTRAVAALLAGQNTVPLAWDTDELDWDMYRRCVTECQIRNVLSPLDLTARVVSEEDYREKWDKWCDAMQAQVVMERKRPKAGNRG